LTEENLLSARVKTLDYYEYFMSILVQMPTLVGSYCEKNITREKKSNIGDLSNIIGLSYSPVF